MHTRLAVKAVFNAISYRDSCNGTKSVTRSVAYYESWASHRPCDSYVPSNIDPTPWTHINFAFALVDNSSQVIMSAQNDTVLYDQMKDLKNKKSGLQIWIAVGGYTVGSAPFSKLAATPSGRSAFINSTCSFMSKYGFDGVDIDWEYPAATDMGGTTADTANFVTLVKEFRDQCKDKGLSITIPGGSCMFSHVIPVINHCNEVRLADWKKTT